MHGSPPPGAPEDDPTVAEPFPPSRGDLTIPQAVIDGRYRIERVVGAGAFGRVYLAFDTRLRNYVAIKELLASHNTTDRATYAMYLERFQREARAVFALQHPNVVSVYEMHEDSAGNLYLVMEYVDGLSLLDLLSQVGVLTVERATAIAIDLARALVAIDERGIVHRDFKPANVMLTKRGVAKLADFGVALIPSETMTRPIGSAHPGSPAYMSPEQATGSGPVDGRSDLYSLGLVMYEMIVGKRYAAVGEPLGVIRHDLSPQLVAIVSKLLQPDVTQRYQNAEEVLHDLTQLSSAPAPVPPSIEPPTAQPPPLHTAPSPPPRFPKRWKGPVFGLTGVVAILLAALIVAQVRPGPTPAATSTPAPTASAIPTPTVAQATPTTVTTATTTSAIATLAPTATPVPTTVPLPTNTPVQPTNTPVQPINTPTSAPVARVPLGSTPAGWKTYLGNARAPFAIYYPPDWIVDESTLTKSGNVTIGAPNDGPALIIHAGTTPTTTSIDTLRDSQAMALAKACAKSGVESTNRMTLSGGVVFDYLLESCDLPQQGAQVVYLVGAGLNSDYLWTYLGVSSRKDFTKNTCNCPAGNFEAFFAPMLNSLRIYGNPVG
ncbi:MAG: protein kinase [Chloroflexota bacterium]|nr:protein kinase [Chloroflexota bacterium]